MKRTHIIFLTLGMALFSSCYKLISTMAPKTAEVGSTIEVSFTVVDDGSDVQNFVNDWSYGGIRVPTGWEVTVPEGAHQQFAEDWVHYEDGSKVCSSHDMTECPKLTEFYNSAFRKSGYTWHAFQSKKKIPKNISACWRNGCDSIRITFLVTIPETAKPGKYTMDFVGGDEEDDAGVEKYKSYTDAKDSRLFHVGTINHSYISNKATNLALQIEVKEKSTAIESLKENDFNDGPSYTLDGKRISTQGRSTGIQIRGGKKVVVVK